MTSKTIMILFAIVALSGTAILNLGPYSPVHTAAAVGTSSAAPWITDITSLQTALQNQFSTLSNSLNMLTNSLNNETASRKAGETALSSQISNLNNIIANPPPKPSQTAAFLAIDGIPGESTDAKHPGTIDIDSWSWGETQTSTLGTGAGAGKVSMQDIHFVSKIDKSSPKLLLATASGEHIKDVTLYVRKAGGSVDYLQIKLTDALVSSYQTGGRSDEIPTESFSINFAKIQYTYTGTDDKGSAITPIQSGWDVLENKLS